MDLRIDPAAAALPDIDWHERFAALGPAFHTELHPTPVPAPYWVARSAGMARELGWPEDWWQAPEALAMVAGNRVAAGSRPLASVYSGHQFGHWAGQLGDGRAILLGEVADSHGQLLEMQLKGSGLTPYSRMGDGRAVLRSSVREFLASEAMHGLGIPTTRALCLTGSDLPVRRETLETAAVVTRVAPSFIRFGHFEHFSHGGQTEQLRQLADFVIEHHYPACRDSAPGQVGNAYAALLATVAQRSAALVAAWQAVGFMHGVMNTDNMSILGLTIDYGPFQFMDGFDPGHICNHSDAAGRYAYNRQPQVAFWNLMALAQALLPLIGESDHALAALEPYRTAFPQALQTHMAAKLGMPEAGAQPQALVESLLDLMASERTDYPLTWRRLTEHVAGAPASTFTELFVDRAAAEHWALQYSELTKSIHQGQKLDLMRKSNPRFVLRNYMAEQAIAQAKLQDFSVLQDLLAVLERPFDEHPQHAAWAGLPPDWASSIHLSCSS